MDTNSDNTQRLLSELKQISATATEKVLAMLTPKLDNNSVYSSYRPPSRNLLYWSSSSDGGGGGGYGVGGSVSSNDAGVGLNSGSIDDGDSDFMNIDSDGLSERIVSGIIENHGESGVGLGGITGNATHLFVDVNDSDYFYHELESERCHSMDSNNISYWNISCDAPLEYVLPLYGYCMPFLMITTVIANALIVIVLSRKSMSTPTNFVLMAMALCDMFTVIFPAPGLWYMYTFGNHYKPMHPVSMCYAYFIMNEVMPAMCHTASIWLTLALAVQRYIYVCHAPMARTWCTMPRVKRCTLYIGIGALLHQSTRFFDRTYYSHYIDWNNQTTEVCHMDTSPWVDQIIGEDIYFTCYFLFRVLFVHLLPCIMLVTLNILLFQAMRQASERRKALFRENRKKECKRLRDSHCTTLMLIVVLTVFLIAEIPIALVTAMHIVSQLIIEFLDYKVANIFIIYTNFFLVLSYPINFGIYCGMSRQFRETFKEIFLGGLGTKKDSSKYSMVNGQRTCTNTNETVL